MTADTDNGMPKATILQAEEVFLPAVIERNESFVRARFWWKVRKFVGRIPFAEEVVASYYCALDPATPARVKAILLAALAYFVLPTDLVPDFITGLGFTDDATVMTMAIGLVGTHIKEPHKAKARSALFKPEPAKAD
jgi:uncharacterized membrane protein YkvA (DUF1232 family)